MRTVTQSSRRRGFSLLELLAVMAIMALLTTMAVTSYFSAVRGMARRSAVKHLANSLILARQRACMEGTRVSVMIFNEVVGYEGSKPKLAPSYVTCKEIGRLSYKGGGSLVDEFAPLEKTFGGVDSQADLVKQGAYNSIRLYNLTQGKWSNVYPKVLKLAQPPERFSPYLQAKKGTSDDVYEIPAYGFVENPTVPNANNASWEVGDAYGVEASPVNALPRGFEFDELQESVSDVICVTFKPDGTSTTKRIGLRSTLPPVVRSSVSVQSDGAITYDEKWN